MVFAGAGEEWDRGELQGAVAIVVNVAHALEASARSGTHHLGVVRHRRCGRREGRHTSTMRVATRADWRAQGAGQCPTFARALANGFLLCALGSRFTWSRNIPQFRGWNNKEFLSIPRISGFRCHDYDSATCPSINPRRRRVRSCHYTAPRRSRQLAPPPTIMASLAASCSAASVARPRLPAALRSSRARAMPQQRNGHSHNSVRHGLPSMLLATS